MSHKSSQVLEKLGKQFPYLNVKLADVEKYPDFSTLLNNLGQYVNNKGLSQQTDKDLKQAKEVLRHARHSWLLNHILYLEVQELLLDYEIRSLDTSLSSRDQQFHKLLQQCLTQAEIGDYLEFSPDPSAKVTALGLTREELQRQNPHKQHISSLQQALIPEVEERLRRKCENLVVAHDPQNSSSDSNKLMFAKSSQLPAMVENDKLQLEENKRQLKEDTAKKEKQFEVYYQTLLDSLHLLEVLISKYKLGKQLEKDTINSEWLYAKCDAMSLKIKMVELQILTETYTVDTVQSLKKIRQHLDGAYKEADREKLQREQAVRSYESVGNGFEQIVTEFGQLKQELENKQWALAEFDKNQNKATRTG
ncbi:HAUS augmin-like complex subunit 4 [Mya arenaria]|uniref:HAUS augmin-like complex subunit 4 n=1 Tax=Mya arenaria TaxID=6604 RepID=UPI0022E34F56|nr:HAUS augmin-like complex subunit 4 [Mya arenaria]